MGILDSMDKLGQRVVSLPFRKKWERLEGRARDGSRAGSLPRQHHLISILKSPTNGDTCALFPTQSTNCMWGADGLAEAAWRVNRANGREVQKMKGTFSRSGREETVNVSKSLPGQRPSTEAWVTDNVIHMPDQTGRTPTLFWAQSQQRNRPLGLTHPCQPLCLSLLVPWGLYSYPHFLCLFKCLLNVVLVPAQPPPLTARSTYLPPSEWKTYYP